MFRRVEEVPDCSVADPDAIEEGDLCSQAVKRFSNYDGSRVATIARLRKEGLRLEAIAERFAAEAAAQANASAPAEATPAASVTSAPAPVAAPPEAPGEAWRR